MLTQKEKALIKQETGWSDTLISYISSFEEYQIYKGLHEVVIDGIICLITDDIPNDNNLRKMKTRGCAMRDASDKPIELHHIGGQPNSPLAELTHAQHHSNGNFAILHDTYRTTSLINRSEFGRIRRRHWKARAAMIAKP